MWTPIRRWTALQSRHRNTPKVADAHDGFRAGQSKQTLFSVFARIFFRMRFFSAVGRQTLSILGSTWEKPGRLDPQRMPPSCSDDILLALLLESLLISYFTWQVKYFVSLLCIKSIIVPIYQEHRFYFFSARLCAFGDVGEEFRHDGSGIHGHTDTRIT